MTRDKAPDKKAPHADRCARHPLPRGEEDELVIRLADHGFEDFGVELDGDHDGALLDAVGSAGDDGEYLTLVGHGLADGEGAVGTKLDGLAAEGDFGVGLGAAVEDHLGIDVKVEVAMAIE